MLLYISLFYLCIYSVLANPQNFRGYNSFGSPQASWIKRPLYNSYNPYQRYSSRYRSIDSSRSFAPYQSTSGGIEDSYQPKFSQYNSPPVLDGQFTDDQGPWTSFGGNNAHQSYDPIHYSPGVANSYEPVGTQLNSPDILNGQFTNQQNYFSSFNQPQQFYDNPSTRYYLFHTVFITFVEVFYNPTEDYF